MIRKFLTFALCGSVVVLAPGFSFRAEKLAEKHVLRREVVVTFDDLPAPEDSIVSNDGIALRGMTERLLDGLRANRIPAVGFVNEQKLYGDNDFEARVGILRMWVNAGFELGNHTFSHLDLNTTPLPDYEEDVLRGEIVTKILLRKNGKRLRYFRYPYLDVGPNLTVRREFEQFLARHGYTVAPSSHAAPRGNRFATVRRCGCLRMRDKKRHRRPVLLLDDEACLHRPKSRDGLNGLNRKWLQEEA